MSPVVWSLEWRAARLRRRLALFNVAIPLLLVVPIALSDAPPPHAAAVYAVLFAFFGTFGSAIPLVRDAGSGLLLRLALTGIPPYRLLLERILAQAAIDTLQLLPALLVIAWAGEPTPGLAAAIPLILAATLVSANALGCWVAAAAASIAEAALLAAVAALATLHAAGVFRTPAPGSIGATLEPLAPFHPLHEALLHTAGIPSTRPTTALAAAALLGATAAIALTTLLAPLLLRALARTRDD
jgi:hypothetical protein